MYKFREDELIAELKAYIDSTYDQHYAKSKKRQTLEGIIDAGHGTGFCIGNVMKYAERYGQKGDTPEEWRKDLMKVLHYALLQMYIHDSEYAKKDSPEIDFEKITIGEHIEPLKFTYGP